MVLIAHALDRVLILPWLFTFGEDGSSMQFVEFDDIYDSASRKLRLQSEGFPGHR